MATNQLTRVLRTLREATLPHEEASLSDGQLLERYLCSREEAAFAALVQRHGPLVWGVCRRVLRHQQDAEDAFQATFLVLVRKAASIASKELVANWLYGVAHQTARKARATIARRGTREKQVTVMPEPAAPQQALWDDLQPLLDQELSRLPDKYRAVIVLCDLEGKTRKDVARHLRLPEGTVASRLATARTMLAKRLARRGVVLSGGALAALVAQHAAAASVPLSVASNTIKAASVFAAGPAAVTGGISVEAVALAEGVLKTMLLSKLTMVAAVLVAVVLLGVSAAAVTQHVGADQPLALASRERERPEEQPVPAAKPAGEPVAQQKAQAEQPVKERKDVEPLPTVVRGVVKTVDAGNNTLTVTYGVGEGTFAAAPDAKITIDGKPGKFAGVPPGANITLSQFTDAKTARSLHANGNCYFGAVVKAIDAERNTITIENRGREHTFAVAQDACINADGKFCKLTDLPRGANVNVALLVDQATACSIGAQGEHLGACGGSMVKTVDVEKRTITFDDKATPDVAGKTFTVGRNANIVIDGGPGKLSDLPPGSYINVILSLDRQTVGTIHANGGPVDCDCGGSPVKAVDADKGTITFADTARAAVAGKTFVVAKNANIVIDGGPGKLSDLPPGAMVSLRLQVDRKTVGTVHANGSGLGGVVKAVDATSSSITVDETTYPVARDALVVINGQQGPLANLQTGTGVNLTLRVDQKTVGMIQTKTP